MTFENVTSQQILDAYNAVFSLRGGSSVANHGPPTQYAEDMLRRMLHMEAFQPFNLALVRSLPSDELLRILFRAVSGGLISGTSALQGGACKLLADPRTGVLELVQDGAEIQTVLTILSMLTLVVLAFMLYKRETA